jgi:hypothetical protein
VQLKHIVIFLLHRVPRRHGREESAFGARFGSTTLSDGTSNRPRDVNEGFGDIEKEVTGAAEDEESMSTEKEECVWIERSTLGG